jgi:TPP-dependent pyruvate/acetoin dehydrogenase alpha subunit
MFDPELYRSKAEVEQWKRHCPIAALIEHARAMGVALDVPAIERGVADEITAAVAYAEAGTLEPLADLARDVMTEPAR